MTTVFVNRQNPEYLKLVEERVLARDLGPDYEDYKWAQETLTRLEKRPCDWDLTEKDLRDLEKMRAVFDRIEARIHAKANFNPAQPRVPAGNPDGGQWTGTGGSTGGGSSPPIPPRKPQRPQKPPKHPHADSPYYDPVTGTYDPPIRPVGDPLSDALIVTGGVRIFKPAAEAVIGGATAVRNALRLRRYLQEARQIPKDVKEVGKGKQHLAPSQQKKLTEFLKERSKSADEIDVTHYSDGRALFSTKQPAKNIPGSYTVWEKQVDSVGKTIRLNKTTVGPNGELIHIKEYKVK